MSCKDCKSSCYVESGHKLLICNDKNLDKEHEGEVINSEYIPDWCPKNSDGFQKAGEMLQTAIMPSTNIII